MGNTPINTKIRGLIMKTKTASSAIGEISYCPNCENEFPPSTSYEAFDSHVTQCLQSYTPSDLERRRRKKSKDSIDSGDSVDNEDMITIEMYVLRPELSKSNPKGNISLQPLSEDYMVSPTKKKQKHLVVTASEETKDSQNSRSRWQKCVIMYSESSLKNKDLSEIECQATPYKILWLYGMIDERRINWKEGAEQLVFHPNHIVRDSLPLLKIDLFQELKLNVINDIVHDAGGLLREWSSLLFKSLGQEYGIFEPSNITTGHYRFCQASAHFLNVAHLPEQYQETVSGDIYRLIGRILAKSVIEKITIPFKFNRLFLRALLGYSAKEVQMKDFQSFDKEIYSSLLYFENLAEEMRILNERIMAMQQEQDREVVDIYLKQLEAKQAQLREILCLNFSISASQSHNHAEIELIKQGKSKQITTHQELSLFIQKMLQFYFSHVNEQTPIRLIITEFNKFIKPDFFQRLLTPQQFELLLNGIGDEEINVNDWKEGTEYKEPYSKTHKVIVYFWNVVEKMKASQKSALLRFVTGSPCLPVFGFKNLETNRGETSYFKIEPTKYDKKKSFFPKAHTCFNRLVLPMYPSQETLREALFGVIQGNFQGVWGME